MQEKVVRDSEILTQEDPFFCVCSFGKFAASDLWRQGLPESVSVDTELVFGLDLVWLAESF
jgi:hypothetical protein